MENGFSDQTNDYQWNIVFCYFLFRCVQISAPEAEFENDLGFVNLRWSRTIKVKASEQSGVELLGIK